MKNLNINTILIAIILILTLANGCMTCTNNRQAEETAVRSKKEIKKLIDSVSTAQNSLIKKEIELMLIIENEVDGKNKKSHELKAIINETRK